jgi:hypothetical protein
MAKFRLDIAECRTEYVTNRIIYLSIIRPRYIFRAVSCFTTSMKASTMNIEEIMTRSLKSGIGLSSKAYVMQLWMSSDEAAWWAFWIYGSDSRQCMWEVSWTGEFEQQKKSLSFTRSYAEVQTSRTTDQNETSVSGIPSLRIHRARLQEPHPPKKKFPTIFVQSESWLEWAKIWTKLCSIRLH